MLSKYSVSAGRLPAKPFWISGKVKMTKVLEKNTKAGNRTLFSGNEAAARAAWESGVAFATGYPGTPSTEIVETLVHYDNVHCEWAPNEKVALEVVAGVSLTGVRSLVTMKHVGLNVAADPLLTLAYTGARGGLVLVVADDPSMHSSQNEQDSRNYARFAKVPMFEPADSDEVIRYMKEAYELSEKYEIPVLFRMSTRLCHGKSLTVIGERKEITPKGYEKNFVRNVMVPANAKVMRVKLDEKNTTLRKLVNEHPFNRIEERSREVGIICAGNVYNYVREALPEASILKIGFSWPIPTELAGKFRAMVERCYVVEELDPIIETELKAVGISLNTPPGGPVPKIGELNPDIIRKLLAPEQESGQETEKISISSKAAPRPPILCAGCPHRGVFMTLKKMRLAVAGDIGCYTLGALSPLESMDSCLCMGASVSMAYGLERGLAVVGDKKTRVVGVIGDSTFMHSGIQPLVNIAYNGGNTTTIILDNSTTAMTGHNENPLSGKTLDGQPAARVDLDGLCRSVGLEFVATVDPYDVELFKTTVKRALDFDGPAVIIARRPCVLLPEERKIKRPKVNFFEEKCTACGSCFRIGCPAIRKNPETGKCQILFEFCTGCGLCTTSCAFEALEL